MFTEEDYYDYTEFHERDVENPFYCRIILERIIDERKASKVRLNKYCYDTLYENSYIDENGMYKGVLVERVDTDKLN